MLTTRLFSRVVRLLPLILAACGSSNSGGNTGSNGASGAVAGTWHGTGSRVGGVATPVTVTVNADYLSIVTDRASISAQRQGNSFAIDYTHKSLYTGQMVTDHAGAQQMVPGSGALGDIPIDVTGTWKIGPSPDDALQGCTTSLDGASASGSCASLSLGGNAQRLQLGTAMATRTQTLSSAFGDLGGEWTVTLSAGGTCTIRIEDHTFVSTCTNAGPFSYTLTMTVNGGVASGQTSEGYEFSAQRQ